jgi:UDP-glucose 4-epimerase
VRSVLRDYAGDAVMHFSAYAYVGESVERPSLTIATMSQRR